MFSSECPAADNDDDEGFPCFMKLMETRNNNTQQTLTPTTDRTCLNNRLFLTLFNTLPMLYIVLL